MRVITASVETAAKPEEVLLELSQEGKRSKLYLLPWCEKELPVLGPASSSH